MAIETYFKNIADAIRERDGSSGLITPAQMPQAIRDIPGGGGSSFVEPGYQGLSYGYYSQDSSGHRGWFGGNAKINFANLFALTANTTYVLFSDNGVREGGYMIGFFAGKTVNDFLPSINNVSSGLLYVATETLNYPSWNTQTRLQRFFYTPTTNGILISISQDNGSTNVKSYCVEMEAS